MSQQPTRQPCLLILFVSGMSVALSVWMAVVEVLPG